MNKLFQRLYLLLTILIPSAGTITHAQNMKQVENISIAQGLSQGMVFDVLQDQEGFIWVATKNGLNRFDGYDFKIYSNDPYNAHTLSSNTIRTLFEDSKGRIWVGTENEGLNIFEKSSGKFFRIANILSNPSSLSGNAIRASMIEMPDGRVLVQAEDAGFNIVELSNDFFKKDAPPVITRLTLPNEAQVYGMGKDKNGSIWIAGMDKLIYRFDPSKNSFTPLKEGKIFNSAYLNEDGNIWANNKLFLYDGKDIFPLFDMAKERAGNILMFTKENLWLSFHQNKSYYDIYKWEPGKTFKWNEPLHVDSAIIYSPFIIDRSGILWAGTMGYGLKKYNIGSSKFNPEVPGFSVRFIVASDSNDIFLGAYPYVWQRLKNNVLNINAFDFIPSVTEVDNFIISRTGEYWIKSDNKGLFKFNPATNKLTNYPEIDFYEGEGDKQPMMEDSKGNIWFPGQAGAFTLINTKTGKKDSFNINIDANQPLSAKAICTALFEDKKGTFWIGTEGGFAKVIFHENKSILPKITWYHNNNTNRNSLNYNHVSCFMDDPYEPENYLWICTKGGGLNRLEKNKGDFIHLTKKDGMPDDVVYGILADESGNIWGSTNRGIFCLNTSRKQDTSHWSFRNFTKAYGLQDDEFNTGAYAKLSNGNLAFGGVNGLNIFNPKEVLSQGFIPNVLITNILVNNNPLLPFDNSGILQTNVEKTDQITLNHLQDILTLEFASLDFTAPNQNNYRYQLVGADKNWVESGTRRSATYLHLPPGDYIFKVQGSNSQGIWSEKIAQLTIKVLPPWWRSWLAYICYALLIAYGIRTYFKFSVNRARLKSQLNLEQLEAKRVKELDLVKTQLYTNITHEFRTPLTVILGMAQQVLNKPEQHLTKGLNMIIRNGESLLKLVNEMLDLSKLETGKMSLNLIQGDIIIFLRYIVESFNSLAESQKKQLHFLSGVDSMTIAYDPEKMRQIITNLLSNALKFTPEKGNIYITIFEEKSLTASNLFIKIKDTGIGVPEAQLDHIFDRFYQIDTGPTRKIEGTGIGLSLTKELVKLMEGEIDVKSPPIGATKGTEFTVTLPVKRLNSILEDSPELQIQMAPNINQYEIADSEQEDMMKESSKKQPLILLVEDNADVVAYTASCLTEYRLAVGKDGREGLEIATQIIPDLIITDVMMPFIDGFEMCRKLREDEHTSHIPIIMLTAKADIESKIEGLEHGADVYLEKPFHEAELLIRIKNLLEGRKNLQQYYIKQAGLTVINKETLIESHEPSPAIVNKIEDEFVKKVRSIIEEQIENADFTVEQLCKQVFMSHSQLHRKLDALTGCSPNKFIRIIRLKKATDLLSKPGISISSIAMDCGYNDAGYFSRVFKQEFGETPQEFRAKILS